MSNNFDVIVIGAGSVGTPIAFEIRKKHLSVVMIEALPSVGQGSNKKAIGGIRATHSDQAKILLSQKSIEIFSTWEEKYGIPIDWEQKGYSFVAYDQEHKKKLQSLLKIQKQFGLNINWMEKEILQEIIPNINPDGLLGGTFSPEDGCASPLMTAAAYYNLAKKSGVSFKFNEKVIAINKKTDVFNVQTTKSTYQSSIVINAAGGGAKKINQLLGIDLPLDPDSHEGAITEPIEKISHPMVVDMRSFPGSANVYFHQLPTGQYILCLTPSPLEKGEDERATSRFLPLLADRVFHLMPNLLNLRVRRTWRGLYPMTPDGAPILGETSEGFYQAIGMCGQGFMLGPGIGQLMARVVTENFVEQDHLILQQLSPTRNFSKIEILK